MTVKPRAMRTCYFKFKVWSLPNGGLNFMFAFEGVGGGQTWWQQTRMWLIGGFSWNSRHYATRYSATTPTMISKRTGWHKVCIAVFGNKVIPYSNCIGALLRVSCNDVWVSFRDDYWECLPTAWLGRDVKARLRLND